MNDFIKQVTENRKHLNLDSAEERAYFALADYTVNPPDFEKIRSKITHYEYAKGGLTFGGIYEPSVFSHLLVSNSKGKRCTERAKYNFQYGFDENDNLIYTKSISIQTEFGYTEWINETWNVITPDEIRMYKFQINGSGGPENSFNYFRLISIEEKKIKSNVFIYNADKTSNYNNFHSESEYYNYENGEISSIVRKLYTHFLLGHMSYGMELGNMSFTDIIKPENRVTSVKALELIGFRGMASVLDDKNHQLRDVHMKTFNKEKSDVLYRIMKKYITEKFVPETKKSAVRLKATRGKTKAKETKFGGKPYIPKGFSYPRKNGEPMVLICQLNFAEIPHLDGYPESGLLQIYLECDETAMFEPESYKIVYHNDISGKNCYKNPFKSPKKIEYPPELADYFRTDYFNNFLWKNGYPEDSEKLAKFGELIVAVGKSMSVNVARHIDVLDELAASYVENRAFNETGFNPISKTDTALMKAFRGCTDYLDANREAEDAKPIAELIDDLYQKSEKQPTDTFSDDVLPLSQNREYKIEAELFEMPFTPEIDRFYEIFLRKFTAFFSENSDFVTSKIEREIINEFLEMLKNDTSPDPSKLLFDIFPNGEYDYIFESLNPSSLDDYDKYGACLVGGFPHFTQGDYRPEAYSELLLQIDSFDYSDGYENTVMWGDGGVINFFIKPENLKNSDFSDVFIGGDCS